MIGVGCTIGTGFFLGSSIAIKKSGFSVLAAFLLAALGTFLVFQQLAKLTADHPVEGSFVLTPERPSAIGRGLAMAGSTGHRKC